jgi:hypothetical protein
MEQGLLGANHIHPFTKFHALLCPKIHQNCLYKSPILRAVLSKLVFFLRLLSPHLHAGFQVTNIFQPKCCICSLFPPLINHHHHQWCYSPDLALASLKGFIIVIVRCGLSAPRSTWFCTPRFSHQRHLVVTTRETSGEAG